MSAQPGLRAAGRGALSWLVLLAAGAALLAWYWRSHSAADAEVHAAAVSPAAAATVAAAPAGSPTGPAADPGASSAAATSPDVAASAPPGSPGDIDQRQDQKIARGLAALPDGSGIVVLDTPPGSPAAELHLQRGDVVTSINGERVTDPQDFVRSFRSQGLPTQLTVTREGRELHLH